MEITINAYLKGLISYEEMMEDLYEYKLRGDNKSYPPCWHIEDNDNLPFEL